METSFSAQSSFYDFIRYHAFTAPLKTAVITDHRSYSYAYLNRSVTALSERMTALGIREGTLVGIHCARSYDMIVAFLAALRIGAPYIPLDPRHPAEFLSSIISDAPLEYIIAHEQFRNRLSDSPCKVLFIDEKNLFDSKTSSSEQVLSNTIIDSPAYVLYTSGSTGTPKGVVIPHRSLINFVDLVRDTLDVSSDDVHFFSAPATYALSIRQVMIPLALGATVAVAGEIEMQDPALFFQSARSLGVTMFDVVPSFLKTWLEWVEIQDHHQRGALFPERLKQVVSVGEPLHASDALRFTKSAPPGVRLINIYGQTETTGIVCSHEVLGSDLSSGDILPIGRPAEVTSIHILNAELLPVPDDTEGEICIDNPCLAAGYLNNMELTSMKFQTVLIDGVSKRVYKTGDVGRRLKDGTILHLGRIDHQIKIRGMRVELGNIEHAIMSHPFVKDAAVVALANESQEKKLYACIVMKDASLTLSTPDLRAYLRVKIPLHMIPDDTIVQERLPLTHHGKIDRSAITDLLKNFLLNRKESTLAYEHFWSKESVPAHRLIPLSTFIIFTNQMPASTALLQQLEEQGHTVIAVEFGSSFQRIDQRSYRINCVDESQYIRLFQSLRNDQVQADYLIHLASITGMIREDELGIETILDHTFRSLRNIDRGMHLTIYRSIKKILFISNGITPVIPEDRTVIGKSTVLGIAATMSIENTRTSVAVIDIPESEMTQLFNHNGVQIISAEITSHEPVTGYRSGKRYVLRYQESKGGLTPIPFRSGGNYLITGGLGDVGLYIAEYLSGNGPVNLLLMNRTPFPAVSEWDRILDDNGHKLYGTINRLKNILSAGSNLHIIQCDISDSAQFNERLISVIGSTGTLHGVIHAAGERGVFLPIIQGSLREHELPFKTKIFGTLNVLRSIQSYQPDFVILFSSVSSLIGRIGYASYCAANSFLDTVAFSHEYPFPVYSINWDSWENTGLRKRIVSQHFGSRMSPVQSSMSPETALRGFHSFLRSPSLNVVISHQDIPQLVDQLLDAGLEKYDTTDSSGSVAATNTVEKSKYILNDIWKNVLHQTRFSSTDNFFDIGGDSLSAVKVVIEIESVFQVSFPITTFFRYPTIEMLAEKINDNLSLLNKSSLFDIHNGASEKAPVLLISPGNVEFFSELVNALSTDHPVFVIKFPGIDGTIDAKRTIEEIALYIISELSKNRTFTRCYVCGYSMAGIIAIELARQYNARSVSVPCTILFDTSPHYAGSYQAGISPTLSAYLTFMKVAIRTRFHLKNVFQLRSTGIFIYLHERISNRFKRFVRTIAAREPDKFAESLMKTRKNALNEYVLIPPVNDLVLFRATEIFEREHIEKDYGWSRVTNTPVKIISIDGGHFNRPGTTVGFKKSILSTPNVEIVAEKMERIIREYE